MTFGFIGAGNIAGAIIKGVVKTGALKGEQIHVFDLDTAKLDRLVKDLGVVKYDTCDAMITDSDIVVMAVKPHQLRGVINQQKNRLMGKAVISIAAGWTVEMLKAELPQAARVLRVMPNTPALVGCGMTVFSRDTDFTQEERDAAGHLFSTVGRVIWAEEHQMEAVTGVSGSGPAYAYVFIEAMADGGVLKGLTREQALEMAAQTLLGSAKMALESGLHPGALKDMVCSPGGTSIEAIRVLEQNGFRSTVIEAVNASTDKALLLKK